MRESTRDFLWERLTSRKLHVTLVGFISATLFLYWGVLPPDLWVELVKWLFGVYVAGNVGEWVARGTKIGKQQDGE